MSIPIMPKTRVLPTARTVEVCSHALSRVVPFLYKRPHLTGNILVGISVITGISAFIVKCRIRKHIQ